MGKVERGDDAHIATMPQSLAGHESKTRFPSSGALRLSLSCPRGGVVAGNAAGHDRKVRVGAVSLLIARVGAEIGGGDVCSAEPSCEEIAEQTRAVSVAAV